MSETPDCPYCGSKVHTKQKMDYDSKIKLRCSNCGGFFEFMPGFGAFTLPEEERSGSIRHEGSGFRPHYEDYEDGAPWVVHPPPPRENTGGTCCGVVICCCCIVPMIMFIFAIIFGFGWFWFWFW